MEFKIGDFVRYRKIRGVITAIDEEISYYGDLAGHIIHYITIDKENGGEFVDYFYVFEHDVEKAREHKLNNILNGISHK